LSNSSLLVTRLSLDNRVLDCFVTSAPPQPSRQFFTRIPVRHSPPRNTRVEIPVPAPKLQIHRLNSQHPTAPASRDSRHCVHLVLTHPLGKKARFMCGPQAKCVSHRCPRARSVDRLFDDPLLQAQDTRGTTPAPPKRKQMRSRVCPTLTS
jgi:hypothetical protein